MIECLIRLKTMMNSSSWKNQQAITTKKPNPATLVPTKLNAREISAMTVKCTFCNDTKTEPGIPGPCVWCDQVGAAPVLAGRQFAKGFTDPVGDCEKFEAGITVNAWLQRIVVYGDSPADAEALRDHIMSSAEREAALREELETRTADLLECGTKRKALQQRLTDAEKLFDAAVTALNEIAKVSRIGEKPFEIATLAIGEMSALKQVED